MKRKEEGKNAREIQAEINININDDVIGYLTCITVATDCRFRV